MIKKASGASFWRFVLPSLCGFFIFMVPLEYHGRRTILLAHMSQGICATLAGQMAYLLTALLVLSAVLSTLFSCYKQKQHQLSWLRLFSVSPQMVAVRITAAMIAILIVTQRGPSWFSEEIGGEVLHNLLPTLFSNLFLSSLFSPLLLQFGLLESIGVLMRPIMRFFKLPGHAAVNCATSWIGDGTVGTVMAIKEYERGGYTEREASIVITNFAAVSITFYSAILMQLRLENTFGVFVSTTIISSLIAAWILPRIPPLSRKRDRYIVTKMPIEEKEENKSRGSLWQKSLNAGMRRASVAPPFSKIITKAGYNALDIMVKVLPMVLLISVFSLLFAIKGAVFFEFIGKPFLPILKTVRIPEAERLAQLLWIGFADMFIPSLLAKNIASEMTRFIIASLSVTQIIYLSELGALLLGNGKLQLKFTDLLILFILRTLITLPIIVLCAHCFFS